MAEQQKMIEQTKQFVMERMKREGSGHDWYHIERVYNTALFLAKKEGAHSFIVALAALLHDLEDWKFTANRETSTNAAEQFLTSIGVSELDREHVATIIQTMSFKGGVVDSTQHTIEGMVVQDADRLDAIGAIGIARAFTYGGFKHQLLYDPNIPPKQFHSLNDVKTENNHTINHFYEKLLKLKDLMNTNSAKEMANERHQFMEMFLETFYKEWNVCE